MTSAPFSQAGVIDSALLLDVLGQQPIAFHRCYIPIVGSITAALWLSYAMYHVIDFGMDQGAWFSKTQEEWQAETGLSRREQETARKKLLDLSIIECRRPGLQRPLEYRINMPRLYRLLEEQARANLPELTTPCASCEH